MKIKVTKEVIEESNVRIDDLKSAEDLGNSFDGVRSMKMQRHTYVSDTFKSVLTVEFREDAMTPGELIFTRVELKMLDIFKGNHTVQHFHKCMKSFGAYSYSMVAGRGDRSDGYVNLIMVFNPHDEKFLNNFVFNMFRFLESLDNSLNAICSTIGGSSSLRDLLTEEGLKSVMHDKDALDYSAKLRDKNNFIFNRLIDMSGSNISRVTYSYNNKYIDISRVTVIEIKR
jgi:hypothetical protein